jgi:DNA processing protein
MENNELLYRIALSLTPGIGCKSYRQLIELCGEPSHLFQMSRKELDQIFGTHRAIAESIASKATLRRAEEECIFIERNNITPLFSTDSDYPQRMNRTDCADTPPLLYCQGRCNLNAKRVVSIVGTRRITPYGRDMAEKIVGDLRGDDILIISGLAYGVDTAAHTAALTNNLPTAAVLGHGLDQLYPPQNRKLAHSILEQEGCLLTEYPSYTKIAPSNFPARNRIIAALADVIIVVEASEKGGALITANIANSYHREVFAVPGRLSDTYSRGCNNLLANNKAITYTNADNLYYNMGWSRKAAQSGEQQQLFPTLTHDEQTLVELLSQEEMLGIEEICEKTAFSLPKVAGLLLNLELENLVRCMPGKRYRLCQC